jgi:hypothetical protein
MSKALAIFIISLGFPSVVNATNYFTTGNDLLSFCNAGHGLKTALCTESAVGYADMMTVLGLICMDKAVTKGQVGDIMKKYLQDHPEERNNPAAGLALPALTKAFPCKN